MSRTIETMRYVNTIGEEVVFGGRGNPLFYGDTDIFDLDMSYRTIGSSITSFDTGIREMSLMAYLRGGSEEDAGRIIRSLVYDARVGTPGTLWAGQSYMKCYISGVKVSEWHYFDGMMNLELTVVADEPAWVRKASATLMRAQDEQGDGIGMDYPHDFPHNYCYSAGSSVVLENPFRLPAKCDIAFPGPCVRPYVIIGDNRYQVNVTADAGQLVIVRGFGQTPDIVVRHSDGTERSVFPLGVREEGAHIFAEIPVGSHSASWSGAYNIEVTMYEEAPTPW